MKVDFVSAEIWEPPSNSRIMDVGNLYQRWGPLVQVHLTGAISASKIHLPQGCGQNHSANSYSFYSGLTLVSEHRGVILEKTGSPHSSALASGWGYRDMNNPDHRWLRKQKSCLPLSFYKLIRKDITKEVKSEQRRLSWIYECEQTEGRPFQAGRILFAMARRSAK